MVSITFPCVTAYTITGGIISITVAAIAVLVATLWLPVLQIYGSSMTPTLQDGEIVFSVKTSIDHISRKANNANVIQQGFTSGKAI